MKGLITLYGSNELINSDENSLVTLASVTALTSLISLAVPIYRMGAKYIRDGENLSGGSGVMVNSGHVRRGYEIRTQGFHWENDIVSMDNLEKILGMKSCFMGIASHELMNTLVTTNKVIALAENSEWEKESVGAKRFYTIFAVNRKRNA